MQFTVRHHPAVVIYILKSTAKKLQVTYFDVKKDGIYILLFYFKYVKRVGEIFTVILVCWSCDMMEFFVMFRTQKDLGPSIDFKAALAKISCPLHPLIPVDLLSRCSLFS